MATRLEKHSVTIFGTSGKILSFGSFGHKNNQFKSPRYVTTSPGNGLLYLKSELFFLFEKRVRKLKNKGTISSSLIITTTALKVLIITSLSVIVLLPQVFDEEGNYKFKFGTKGRGDGQMSFPEGIAYLDWAGGLLLADEGNNRFEVKFKGQKKLTFFDRVDFYTGDGKFRNHILVECDGISSPQGIVVNEDRIMLLSSETHQLKLFDLKHIRF